MTTTTTETTETKNAQPTIHAEIDSSNLAIGPAIVSNSYASCGFAGLVFGRTGTFATDGRILAYQKYLSSEVHDDDGLMENENGTFKRTFPVSLDGVKGLPKIAKNRTARVSINGNVEVDNGSGIHAILGENGSAPFFETALSVLREAGTQESERKASGQNPVDISLDLQYLEKMIRALKAGGASGVVFRITDSHKMVHFSGMYTHTSKKGDRRTTWTHSDKHGRRMIGALATIMP